MTVKTKHFNKGFSIHGMKYFLSAEIWKAALIIAFLSLTFECSTVTGYTLIRLSCMHLYTKCSD